MSDAGLSEEALAVFRVAEKRALLEISSEATIMDREAIMALLPHRDPLLLLDRVTHLDRAGSIVAARYDLTRARDVLGGHFPTRPMYPGVLQIEAIGQAGILLGIASGQGDGETVASISLTHVRMARFLKPVTPGADLEIVARIFDDGFFLTVVGQCLQHGVLCSAAALSGLVG